MAVALGIIHSDQHIDHIDRIFEDVLLRKVKNIGVQLGRQTDKFRFTLLFCHQFNIMHHLLLSVSNLVKSSLLLANDKSRRHLLFILNVKLLHETAHVLVFLVNVLKELIPADDLPGSFISLYRES